MFELEVFRKQMYCIQESNCDIVGTFRRPSRSDSAPGELCPPSLCPWMWSTQERTRLTLSMQWNIQGNGCTGTNESA